MERRRLFLLVLVLIGLLILTATGLIPWWSALLVAATIGVGMIVGRQLSRG